MGCLDKIEKIICFFDTYSTSFQVRFQNKSTFQTTFGGLVSLILLLLLLAVIIFLYIFLENRDEQKIVPFNQRYLDPPEIIMSSNYSNITYSTSHSNYGFFFYSIYFYNLDNNQPLLLEKITEHFNFLSKDINNREPTDIPLIKCNDLYPDLIKTFNESRIKNSYCVNQKTFISQGDYISDTYRYVLLRIVNNNEKFSVAQAEFVKILGVVLFRSDYTINTQIKEYSPISYIIKPYEIPIAIDVSYEANIFVSSNKFLSNDNLYAPWQTKKIQNCFKVQKIEPKYMPQTDNPGRLMSIYLRSSYSYETQVRDFKSFLDLLCQIGGVWRVFIFIGVIIVSGLNLTLMNVSISNKLFNMVHPNNEDDVQMLYDDYETREMEYNKVPEIFISLNPVLKQLSFDYYRFERNKGMDFTLKEAFTKMFCCCCKIKSIRSKDMIFLSSKSEIGKRLDLKTISRFAQEVKLIKKVLLRNYFRLIDYHTSGNIDYSLLDKIRQDDNEHNVLSTAKPLSLVYYKQSHLVSAFNILRNQGDLTKTDILMIKLFQLNPELVLKFFLTYYDRFELIYPDLFKGGKHQSSADKNKEHKIIIGKKKQDNRNTNKTINSQVSTPKT